jgi:hypothetical protein
MAPLTRLEHVFGAIDRKKATHVTRRVVWATLRMNTGGTMLVA